VPLRRLIAPLLLLLARSSVCYGQDQIPVIPHAATAACAQFDPAATANSNLSADEALQVHLLAVYNTQARLVRSLKGVATVRATHRSNSGSSRGRPRDLTAFINFEQPARIRVTGVAPPLGAKVFDLASDGREFHLLAPDHEKMKFFVGRVDAQPGALDINSSEVSDLARPREILDMLRWQEGTLRTPSSSTIQTDTLEFDLPPHAGKAVTGTLHFNSQSGEAASLQLSGAGGELLSEISYADWQPVSDPAGGSSPACFPRRVRLVRPAEDLQVDIRFLELTLNPKIPRSTFHISPAPGVAVVRLNLAGTEKGH
jgi:hypothetical protein